MIEKKHLIVIWVSLSVASLIFFGGCLASTHPTDAKKPVLVAPSNPQNGIQNWIDAVNARNVDLVYNLSPDEIKDQVSLDEFRQINLSNPLLKPGNEFLNFTIYDEVQNGTYSEIKAQVWLKKPTDPNSTTGSEVPLQYKFALFFEHGEWKVWTI